MLYFHLNMTNFIDPMINGEENNIGIIETFFLMRYSLPYQMQKHILVAGQKILLY